MSRRCPSCQTVFSDAIFFCGNDGTITIEEQDPSDQDPRLGQTLGAYVVVARVADGAMGRVYEGRHTETKARVAIKVLHEEVARDRVAVERFKREYETADGFDHPNIVKVLDFGETEDDSWFMTMEYLDGEELGNVLRREGAQPLDRLVRVISQASIALDYAHSFGVIHRDLKPDNVFLCRSEAGDVVKILDFGSVKLQLEMGPKLTAFGTTLGSPYYMSPEQAMGKDDVDQRTDLFALGAIAYEMATGKIAFDGSSVAEILMKLVNDDPVGPSQHVSSLPPAFDDVVLKALRKEKERRYGKTTEFAAALAKSLGLEADPNKWARTAASEISEALAGTSPPPPKPFGTTSAPPPSEMSADAIDAAPMPAPAALPNLGGAGAPGPAAGPPPPSASTSQIEHPDARPVGSLPPYAMKPARSGLTLPVVIGLAVVAVLALGGLVAVMIAL